MGDPLFQGIDEAIAFGSNPDIQIIEDICSDRGLLTAFKGKSIRRRAQRLDGLSQSLKIKDARRTFYSGSK